MKKNQKTQSGKSEIPTFPLDFICEWTRGKYECFSCSHIEKIWVPKNYGIRLSADKYNHNPERQKRQIGLLCFHRL